MSRFRVLQLVDSAFPTGGFAHSGGLEAAMRLGEVEADLDAFVDSAVWQAGWGALPFVASAHDAPERLAELDAACDAMLLNPVANRASRTQGRALAATCARVFDVTAVDEGCRARTLRVHLAPAFGALTRALDVTKRDALEVHLYGALRSVTSAAVRLGLVGPNEAQRMIVARAPLLERVLARCGDLRAEQAAQAAPIADLFAAAHDRLDARMFVS
jgi:urease accessory protein